nr:MAG TPA: helix-turn-helix domain protein [Caudoviricetes sp.]
MNIRQLREKSGIRQEDVAAQLKIDRSTVAKWETGEAMPRSDKLPDLAKILHCSIADLF